MSAVKKQCAQMGDYEGQLLPSMATDIHFVPFDLNIPDAAANVIHISENTPPDQILKVALKTQSKHFVQTDSMSVENELNTAALMINNPKLFFANPVGAILKPKQIFDQPDLKVEIYSRKFSDLREKYEILEEIEKVVSNYCKSSSFIYDVQSIADEFVTNAIFHATGDINLRKNFLTDNKVGEIFIGIENDAVVIGCKDPHGSLIPRKLFERIHTCYTSDVASNINMGRGGAGIGSFLVHNMSTSYFLAVDEGKQTIICAMMPLNMSNRKRLKLPKNLHYLYIKEINNG